MGHADGRVRGDQRGRHRLLADHSARRLRTQGAHRSCRRHGRRPARRPSHAQRHDGDARRADAAGRADAHPRRRRRRDDQGLGLQRLARKALGDSPLRQPDHHALQPQHGRRGRHGRPGRVVGRRQVGHRRLRQHDGRRQRRRRRGPRLRLRPARRRHDPHAMRLDLGQRCHRVECGRDRIGLQQPRCDRGVGVHDRRRGQRLGAHPRGEQHPRRLGGDDGTAASVYAVAGRAVRPRRPGPVHP